MCLAPSEIIEPAKFFIGCSHFGGRARKTSRGRKPSPLLGPTQLLPLSLTLSHSFVFQSNRVLEVRPILRDDRGNRELASELRFQAPTRQTPVDVRPQLAIQFWTRPSSGQALGGRCQWWFPGRPGWVERRGAVPRRTAWTSPDNNAHGEEPWSRPQAGWGGWSGEAGRWTPMSPSWILIWVGYVWFSCDKRLSFTNSGSIKLELKLDLKHNSVLQLNFIWFISTEILSFRRLSVENKRVFHNTPSVKTWLMVTADSTGTHHYQPGR